MTLKLIDSSTSKDGPAMPPADLVTDSLVEEFGEETQGAVSTPMIRERTSLEIHLVERKGVPCMMLSQIADLFDKRETDVRKSLESLDGELLHHVEFIRDSRGYISEAYIPERPALMLVTGFTGEKAAKVRLACVDAFLSIRDLKAKAAANPLAVTMANFGNDPMAAYAMIAEMAQRGMEETRKRLEAERLLETKADENGFQQKVIAGQAGCISRLTRKVRVLEAEQTSWVTPTEIGELKGRSAQEINKKLMERGLQTRSAKGRWELTEAGHMVAKYQDFTTESYASRRILWDKDAVLEMLNT